MKKVFLKIALLALVTVGCVSATTVGKKKENKLVGTWVCTDSLYKQGGTLQLIFKEDNTVIGINTSKQASVFDSLKATYEYKDNLLYLNGRENHKITFRSDDKICLEYLWVILEIIDPKYPVGLYNFERIGGAK
jgi:hypothetical protein